MEAENMFPLSDVVVRTPSPSYFHHDQDQTQHQQRKASKESVLSPIRNPVETNDEDLEANKNEFDTLNESDVEKNDSKSKWANPGLRKFKIALGLKKKSAIDIKSLSQSS
jgi:hypothetical protein